MRRLALLVTGAGGQLGADLLRVTSGCAENTVIANFAGNTTIAGFARDATAAGCAGGTPTAGRLDVAAAHGLTRAELDITDGEAVQRQVGEWVEAVGGTAEKLVCVNTAAYTAVDAAESDADRAYAVNVRGPAALAAACGRYGVGMVHVSTDYVFAGDATVPYQVNAPTGPRSVYGSTKLAGEQAVRGATERCWVVRTAWLYGQTGGNFVKTMVRLERARETLDVVDDQCGSPTWSADLARGLVALAGSDAPPGVYHCTNGGQTTWYGLARAVFEEVGADPERVRPTTTAAFPRPAPRPAYSVLSDTAWRSAGLAPLPHWREALHTAFTTAGDALRTG